LCDEPNVPDALFGAKWYTGVSACIVDEKEAVAFLSNEVGATKKMEKLAEALNSETSDAKVNVGCKLDGTEQGQDTAGWLHGFDGTACCVGLYSSLAPKAPRAGVRGLNRASKRYYLVAKAGGGAAAATFHSRLSVALKKGASLSDALGDAEGASPGSAAFERVKSSGARNRARILATAANVLQFDSINTISDSLSSPCAPARMAIVDVSVDSNTLRFDAEANKWLYFAGAVDGQHGNTGVISCSALSEGFVLFEKEGSLKVGCRNDAAGGVPFVSMRLEANRDLVNSLAETLKSNAIEDAEDRQFIDNTFCWRKSASSSGKRILPFGLLGSHDSSSFATSWLRELGLADLKLLSLQPVKVVVASMDCARARAIERSLR